jgi:hypothetical protein
MTPVAYRELWTSADSSITVQVHLNGRRTLDGQPEITSGDVQTILHTHGYSFSHLLPKTRTNGR